MLEILQRFRDGVFSPALGIGLYGIQEKALECLVQIGDQLPLAKSVHDFGGFRYVVIIFVAERFAKFRGRADRIERCEFFLESLFAHEANRILTCDHEGMKALICISLLAFAASAADVPPGTHLLLRMMNSINTRTAAEGDQVYLQTASPIAADGRVLIPTGSYVQGVVTHTKRSGMVAGRAELGIRRETLTLPGGKALKISPRLGSVDGEGTGQKVDKDEGIVKQAPEHGKDAARIAILAGEGAAIGGIADRAGRARESAAARAVRLAWHRCC